MTDPVTKDIPHPGTLPPNLAGLQRSYEILRSLIPRLVAFEDLVALQLATRTAEGLQGAAGTTNITQVIEGGGPGSDPPDYTPPPTPTGLAVTAAFTNLLIEHDDPSYTEGHGHDLTVVYGAKWPTSDPTAPTFVEAVELFRFRGSIAAYPTETGTRWCIWAKWVSVDGEASSPAGGTNGAQATTGKIGNVDLGPLIVEAENLAAQVGGGNLVLNSSFEGDANGDGLADDWTWAVGGGGDVDRVHDFSRPAGCPGLGGQFSQQLQITAAGNVLDSVLLLGVPLSVAASTKYVVSGHLLSNSGGAIMLVRQLRVDDSIIGDTTTTYPGGSVWLRVVSKLATAADCAKLQVMFRGIDEVGEFVRVDGVQVEQGDVLTAYAERPNDLVAGIIKAKHLSANSIAVGSAAIQDGAIRRALIELAAIDDARVANLSAAKVTFGVMSGDRIDVGTLQADRIVAGTFQADNALTRGLTVRDGAGNIILSAGNPLAAANITPSAGWLNANVSLSTSAGTISLLGAGGGSATGVVMPGNQITSANVSTYIASAAIGDAYISNLSVDKLLAGSLSVGRYIQSNGFVAGSTGWRISADGTAEFGAATIRGQLTTAQIQVGAATTGGNYSSGYGIASIAGDAAAADEYSPIYRTSLSGASPSLTHVGTGADLYLTYTAGEIEADTVTACSHFVLAIQLRDGASPLHTCRVVIPARTITNTTSMNDGGGHGTYTVRKGSAALSATIVVPGFVGSKTFNMAVGYALLDSNSSPVAPGANSWANSVVLAGARVTAREFKV